MSFPFEIPLQLGGSGPSPGDPTAGAGDLSAREWVRIALNPRLIGPTWEAVVDALAAPVQYLQDLTGAARDQLHRSTASHPYLSRLAASWGVSLPSGIGMPDEAFRVVAVREPVSDVAKLPITRLLESYYGAQAVTGTLRAGLDGPYRIQNMEDLVVVLDRVREVRVWFRADDFAAPVDGATPEEVAAAINRAFRDEGVRAWCAVERDQLTGQDRPVLYAGSYGLASSVEVAGGAAQRWLRFPEERAAFGSSWVAPTWTVTVNPDDSSMTWTATVPGSIDLTVVQPGDYAVVQDPRFSPQNRGTWEILEVRIEGSGPTRIHSWRARNPAAVAESSFQDDEGSILFFARQRGAPEGGLVVAQYLQGLQVRLPATSELVGREPPRAAYLRLPDPLSISSLTREPDGTCTVLTSSPHGFQVGDQVLVEEARPSLDPPAIGAADLTTPRTAYSTQSVLSDLQTLGGIGCDTVLGVAVRLRGDAALVAGGEDSLGAPVDTSYTFRLGASDQPVRGAVRYQYTIQASGAMVEAVSGPRASWGDDGTDDGEVLVTGGRDALGDPVDRAQVWRSGTWSDAGAMSVERAHHAQVRIEVGGQQVHAVFGGQDVLGAQVQDVEYLPVGGGTWTALAAMPWGRSRMGACRLQDGRVVIVGGEDGSGDAVQVAALYDPSTDTWTETGPMQYARMNPLVLEGPDGSVWAIGGLGRNPTQSGTDAALASVEILDPQTGRWRPGPQMRRARSGPTGTFTSSGDLLVWGTAFGTGPAERLPAGRDEWVATTPGAPDPGSAAVGVNGQTQQAVLLPASGTVLLAQGLTSAPAPFDRPYLYVPATDLLGAGGLTGVRTVQEVPGAQEFRFRSEGGAAEVEVAVARPMAAPTGLADQPGPILFDPQAGLHVLPGTRDQLDQQVLAGSSPTRLVLQDASGFPDQPGWVVIDFGLSGQVGPIRYLGRLSGTELRLDGSLTWPTTSGIGATVTLLGGAGPLAPTPEQDEQAGAFWLTDSTSARRAAERSVRTALAAGAPARVEVLYPGGRGLGAEGAPTSGQHRLSDVVRVWGADDPDAELTRAREGV